MGETNGLVARAIALLTSRWPPSRRIGFDDAETTLLRRAGVELLASLSDAEIAAEQDRRARETLIGFGLLEKRNARPPRPRTPFDDRIAERREREREHKAELDQARETYFSARDALVAAGRADDEDREEQARHAAADAKWEFERAESAWRRCRSGRHALELARSRWLGLREYEEGLQLREKRRQRQQR